MNEIKVGLIGFGAIGREVAEAIVEGRAGRAQLASILVRSPEKIQPGLADRLGCRFTTDAADFLDTQLDLVIEAAGHDALKAHAEAVLRANKDLMVVAVGAFADDGLWQRVNRLAHERGRRVYLVSGAIAGLDAISSASLRELTEVTHSIRKPPHGLLPEAEAEQVRLGGQPKELFAGTA